MNSTSLMFVFPFSMPNSLSIRIVANQTLSWRSWNSNRISWRRLWETEKNSNRVEMEGTSRGDVPRREEGPSRQTDPLVQITRSELQRLVEETGRNALVQHKKRTVTPIVQEVIGRQLFKEREVEKDQQEETSREELEKGHEVFSEVGSSERDKGKKREPGISRVKVDDVGRQIERLGKQIGELKRRGEIVAQNRNFPFSNKILTEVVDPSFRMPDLPKYDGTKDPQEHVAVFELVMNLNGQSSSINAKLFVTTLTGKVQEWLTSLPSGGIETFEQLIQKFTFYFASKKRNKSGLPHICLTSCRRRMSL
ncbi:UNVERIFIED_CONTAM: hypothetical protein Sradi_3502900 [Sesamum radiatum]|uniref:Retrotransposon gag domain-containing protein n=1 Tax=Sesamum radiatum TaxID=300843 RepID=A0AAW2QFN1_SESRA